MESIHFKKPASLDEEIVRLKTEPARYWEERGEKRVRELAQFVYDTTPAYREFLASKGVRNLSLATTEDFQKLPILDKDSYLRKHEYIDLFPNQSLEGVTTTSATSGSTGEPFFFPRNETHDAQYEYIAEIFFRNQWDLDKKRTLGIIGFAFGIWIGGIFTYKNLNRLSSNGYSLSLIPVGTNKDGFLQAVKKFGPHYEQVILMGYPPFIKDVLDQGAREGIDWKKYHIKILTAAEGFTEAFKEYLAEKAGLENVFRDKINMYGSVELGTMAHETVLSSLIRRIAHQDKRVFEKLFPRTPALPTLAQYYPHITYFEEVEGEVIASGYGSSIPLIRYRFSDLGGVITYDEMVSRLEECGVDILAEARKYGLQDKIFHLPFVYLYGRSDHVVIFRGANIYPNEIKNALDKRELSDLVTGKFTLIRREDVDLSQKLEINVELREGVSGNSETADLITETIVETLRDSNSEFKNEFDSDPERARPQTVLWPYQHETHFGGGGKQRWVKKT